jgi:Rieske Fe-S protein
MANQTVRGHDARRINLMSLDPSSRRRFLGACASAGTCALARCTSNNGTPEAFGDVAGGNVKDLPVGSVQVMSSAPAILARDAQGVYAMTATCTHAGCDVGVQASAPAPLRCPCHGSEFDANGGVVRGPARGSLAHFAVEIDASGNVTVHGSTQVEATVRVAVPKGLA